MEKVHEKIGVTFGIPVHVHYYIVKIIGGKQKIQDPDGSIYKVEWKRFAKLKTIPLSFPEDYQLLQKYMNETIEK